MNVFMNIKYDLPKNGCTFGLVMVASSSGVSSTAISVVGVASPLVLGPCFSTLSLVLAESADESTLVLPVCVGAAVISTSSLLPCGSLSSFLIVFFAEEKVASLEVSISSSEDTIASAVDGLFSVVDGLVSVFGEQCPFDLVTDDFRLLALGRPTFPVCLRAVQNACNVCTHKRFWQNSQTQRKYTYTLYYLDSGYILQHTLMHVCKFLTVWLLRSVCSLHAYVHTIYRPRFECCQVCTLHVLFPIYEPLAIGQKGT